MCLVHDNAWQYGCHLVICKSELFRLSMVQTQQHLVPRDLLAVPVATFLMAILCGTDKPRCDFFLNMVLTQILLQKKGLTLNPLTSLYYIAPCRYTVLRLFRQSYNMISLKLFWTSGTGSAKGGKANIWWTHVFVAFCSFLFLSIPWILLEKPEMNQATTKLNFDFWVFFTNALCALVLNFSVFLVIGRTGALTVRVAGVLKDWILIALSTLIFPDSKLTVLNVTGYGIGMH